MAGDNLVNLPLLAIAPLTALAALAVGFRPAAMMRVMIGAALVHGAIVAIALLTSLGADERHPAVVGTATVIFVAMWLTSATLFRRAARG